MALHLTATVSCDACSSYSTYSNTNMVKLKRALRLGGWTTDRGLDFCGPCSLRRAGHPSPPLPFPGT